MKWDNVTFKEEITHLFSHEWKVELINNKIAHVDILKGLVWSDTVWPEAYKMMLQSQFANFVTLLTLKVLEDLYFASYVFLVEHTVYKNT